MTTQQERHLFRALRLIGRLLCIIVYNQHHYPRPEHLQLDEPTIRAQKDTQEEASIFFKHEL